MAESFKILGREIIFSQERINYVNLKWEYQNLSYAAEAKMLELFPDSKIVSSGDADVFSSITDNPFMKELACKKYPNIAGYIDERTKYLKAILDILYYVTSNLNDALKANKVYLSMDSLLEIVFEKSSAKKVIGNIARYIKENSKPHVKQFTFIGVSNRTTYNGYYDKIYQDIEKEVLKSENDISDNSYTAKILLENIIKPFDQCFLAAYDSETYNVLFQKRTSLDVTQTTEYTPVMNDREIPQSTLLCLKALVKAKEFQDKLVDAISNIVFLIFIAKMHLFSDNGLSNYYPITKEDVERAKEIRKIVKEGGIPEDDEKELMIEMISIDTFEPSNYYTILDRYYDPDGEIQRLAKVMGVDVLTHIENQLLKIYNDGDIGTLESTLELKQQILEKQNKYCINDSKAFHKVMYRQYFLELSRKADKMTEDSIIEAFTSIKNGANEFVEDKGKYIDDDSCILILTRSFKKINAAKYIDIINNLKLIDDASSDHCYAFYKNSDNYLDFEEKCLKAVSAKIEYDDDISIQTYGEDKFASGEVILGYFQYTRALDLITDGKCLIITNKRIYTQKNGFIDISQFKECYAVKKLLLAHLIVKLNDSSEIQLPVNKDVMNEAADMINRLLKALKNDSPTDDSTKTILNEEYLQVADDSTKTILNEEYLQVAANTIKQGFSSLFGKIKKGNENNWTCNCGSFNNGAFCPKCGTKRP